MYRVFNMGIGMVAVVRAADAETAFRILRKCGEEPRLIGTIRSGATRVELVDNPS